MDIKICMPPNMWKNPKKSDKLGVLSPVPVDNCVDNVDFCITHAVNIHVEHTIYVRSCNKFSWIQPSEDRELGQRAHGAVSKRKSRGVHAAAAAAKGRRLALRAAAFSRRKESRVWRQIAAAACATGRASTCIRS